VGGGESPATVLKRQLRWWEQNPKACRLMRAKPNRPYYLQFQERPEAKESLDSGEIERITAQNRPTDRELSTTLGRSMQAIQRRRYAAGVILNCDHRFVIRSCVLLP
jgi:hypothetical protein